MSDSKAKFQKIGSKRRFSSRTTTQHKNKSTDTCDLKKTKNAKVQTQKFFKTKSTQSQVQANTTRSSQSNNLTKTLVAKSKINQSFLATIGQLKTENNIFKEFIDSDVKVKELYEIFVKKRSEAALESWEGMS